MVVPDTQGLPTLGRYTLVREIARSNDVVWEARDPQMHRKVAVKELALPPTLAGHARVERIERFYREARAAGAMSHPNIVTIYEIGEEQGRYFIAMEFLEGTTLRERLSVGGALPLSEAIGIAGALCQALAYAHARGVIHRDIKPDNVHLLPGGGVKLTDFGIARITHEDALTVDGQVFGTPSYMSPEQVVGRQIDARSDLFSLGIVLFEMLSGKKPFTGDSVVTITYQIMNADMPSLPGAGAAVEAVLRRALAKDPNARFATVREMQTALQLAAAHSRTGAFVPDPVPALPYSAPQATVAYGTQTRQGALPGAGMPPAAGPVAAPVSAPAQRAGRNLVTILLSVLLIGGFILGGAWVLGRAYQNFQREAQRNADVTAYQDAARRYDAGAYEEAAALFKRLRESSGSGEIVNKATLGELYSYRKIGARYVDQQDYAMAERWFRAAVQLAPSDPQARRELNDVLKYRGAPDSAGPPSIVPPAGEGSPGSAVPAGNSTESGTAPSPPGPSNLRSSDFVSNNAAKAAEAAGLLRQGNAAWQRGAREEAVRLWTQATQAGPGSPAAIEAQQHVTAYNSDNPPW